MGAVRPIAAQDPVAESVAAQRIAAQGTAPGVNSHEYIAAGGDVPGVVAPESTALEGIALHDMCRVSVELGLAGLEHMTHDDSTIDQFVFPLMIYDFFEPL